MRDFWIFGAIKTRQASQSTSRPATLAILEKTGTGMIKFTDGNYAGREAEAKQNKTRPVDGIYDLTFVDNNERINEADLKIDPNWIEIPNVKEYEAPNYNTTRPPGMPDEGDTIMVYWSMEDDDKVHNATVLEQCQDERYKNWYKLRYTDGDVRWENLGEISWWSTWEQSPAAFGVQKTSR